jgi:hypothetical protein
MRIMEIYLNSPADQAAVFSQLGGLACARVDSLLGFRLAFGAVLNEKYLLYYTSPNS